MKNLILLASLTFSSMIFAQDPATFAQDTLMVEEAKETRIFTVNPSKDVRNTTGINVGVLDEYQKQTISGLNFQANPVGLIYFMFPRAIDTPSETNSTVKVNGLHLSTGGMLDGNTLNGVGVSAFHHAINTNGFTVNFFNNTSDNLNGLHISGFYNEAIESNGLMIAISNDLGTFNGVQIGLFNKNEEGKGMQIGIYNRTEKQKGLQVGLINKSKAKNGLQIGFWNKNAKRTLPIINF